MEPLRPETDAAPLDFPLVDHHTLLVVPFGFAGRRAALDRLDRSAVWSPRRFRPDDTADAERTSYFLPYVRRYLFPDPGSRPEATCQRYRLDLTELGGSAERFEFTLAGTDQQEGQDYREPTALVSAEVLVFPFDVGMLVLDLRCAGAGATYGRQMKGAGMARMMAPLYLGRPLPTWEAGPLRFHTPQLVAWLLAEFGPGGRTPRSAALGAAEEKPPTPVKLVYDDRAMVHLFSCLDKSTVSEDAGANESALRKLTLIPFDADTLAESDKQKAAGLKRWLRGRWQSFAKDGGSLVAFANDPFDATFLGLYHRTYYFDVFLLAAMQRVALLLLDERLSDIPSLTTGGAKSRAVLGRLRHDLLLFKNQCCFSQITLKERGLHLWKRWRATFENDSLLKEVNDQSHELEQYLQAKSRERMEWLLRIGGFVATAVPAVLGLEALLGDADWVKHLKYALLGLVVLAAGAGTLVVLLRKDRYDD